MEKIFDIQKAKLAQKQYTEVNKAPHFAPNDGQCWKCRKNIYSEINGRGIDVEKAGKELVTGCPHCFRSYCE